VTGVRGQIIILVFVRDNIMLKKQILGFLIIVIGLFLAACGYKTPQGGGALDGTVVIVTPTPLPATASVIAGATALANQPTATATPSAAPPTNTPAVVMPATPTPKPPDTPKPQPTLEVVNDSYTVKEGDTLLGIAIRLGLDLDDLVELNKIQDRNNIKVGQVLKIPKRTPTPRP
jgi:LysM repeat protein